MALHGSSSLRRSAALGAAPGTSMVHTAPPGCVARTNPDTHLISSGFGSLGRSSEGVHNPLPAAGLALRVQKASPRRVQNHLVVGDEELGQNLERC